MRTLIFGWLLLLFPPSFREEFAHEIHEYLVRRHLEEQAAGRWRTALLSAQLAAELVWTALMLRASVVSLADLAVWFAASVAGLGISLGCLSLVLLAFDTAVRTPLLDLAKDGTAGTAPYLTAVGVGIAILAGVYASVLPGPDKGRHCTDRPE